ncbi:MAG: ABC transporter permease, partial [Gemmatimonadaceae bacterium]
MSARRGWRRVFRLDVGQNHVERDVEEELAFHLAMRADRLRAEGVAPDAAPGQALTRFGDLGAIREECITVDHDKEQAVKRGNRWEHAAKDVVYTLRSLRHHAGFSAVVILTLALGIGANATIFSVVDALLLRSIPVSHPEQLVAVGNTQRVNSLSIGLPRADLFSYPLYKDLRDNNTVFSGLYGNSTAGALSFVAPASIHDSAAQSAAATHPHGRFVTANYFHVLGVTATEGRVFALDEDRVPGAGAVVVISNAYWQHEFNRDRGAIGRTVTINGVPMTVVGVTPPTFTGDLVAQETDLWIPISMEPALNPTQPWLTDRNVNWLLLMGRRKPGVSFAQARDQVAALVNRMLNAGAHGTPLTPSVAQSVNAPVSRGGRGFSYWRGEFANSLYTLMVAVGLVLLIVCANVANLMLGRAASRGREIGVRLALGAGRLRLVQQLMIESLVLALAGAALGVLLAHWGIVVLLRTLSSGKAVLPIDAGLNRSVLVLASILGLGTALLFGLAPALRATRIDLAGVLRAHSRGLTGGWRRFSAGRALVMLQVALSLVMLVATGMVVRSLRALETRGMGLDRDHLLIVSVRAEKMHRSDAALGVLRTELTEQLSALPGVAGVTYSANGIFSGNEITSTIDVPGFVARTSADSTVNLDAIGPGYFHTIGGQMLGGRDVERSDESHAGTAVVVNAAFVKKYFPDGSAVGHQVRIDSTAFEIVGVAADVHDHDLRGTPSARLYQVMGDGAPDFTFEIRTTEDPAALVEP